MKLQLIDDDGTILWTLDDVEDFNLDKSIAAGVLESEVKEAVQQAQAERL